MIRKILKIIINIKYDFRFFVVYFLNKRIFKKFDLILKKKQFLSNNNETHYEKFLKISETYTMCSLEDRKNIIDSINYIERNSIEGDIVECGVWKGGNLMLLKFICEDLGLKKNIYGFDLFDDMPNGGEYDFDKYGKKPSFYKNHPSTENEWCKSSLEELKINLNQHFESHNIKLIKGDVCLTLKSNEHLPEKISLLRLDTDFYESTKCELDILYPKLSKGGVLIIDDYNEWNGSRKAVDDFFDKKNVFFHQIVNGGVYLIKE